MSHLLFILEKKTNLQLISLYSKTTFKAFYKEIFSFRLFQKSCVGSAFKIGSNNYRYIT